jgi:hypothetical protein
MPKCLRSIVLVDRTTNFVCLDCNEVLTYSTISGHYGNKCTKSDHESKLLSSLGRKYRVEMEKLNKEYDDAYDAGMAVASAHNKSSKCLIELLCHGIFLRVCSLMFLCCT